MQAQLHHALADAGAIAEIVVFDPREALGDPGPRLHVPEAPKPVDERVGSPDFLARYRLLFPPECRL